MINKDEKIITSPTYIGYLILKKLKLAEDSKMTLYEMVEKLKEDTGMVHYRQFMFSLIFLYQAGVIDFAEPYIYKK